MAVLCAQPSYELKSVHVPTREFVNGVAIVRVGHPRFNRNHLLGRAVNVLTVSLRIFIQAIRQFRRGDVVIVVTNPPVLPFAIFFAAKIRRTSVVLLVHDLYPEAAILGGLIRQGSLQARIWMRASDWLFGRVTRIVVLGRDTKELLAARMLDADQRIRVIPNWADVDEVYPRRPEDNPLIESLGLKGRFVLGYAGNMGRVQDVELLVSVARALRHAAPEVHLLFVGSGSKEKLVSAAASEGRSNVTLVGPRERSEQDIFLNACHVSVMALTAGMAGVGVPSRLYNALAAGRPILAAVDENSEPARVIREADVGIQTPPGDVTAFIEALESIRRDPSYLREAGHRARRVAVERFGFDATLAHYRDLLTELGWEPTST